MPAETPFLSDGFKRLYCDAEVFDAFSAFHAVDFGRVLPFEPEDPIVDDRRVIEAEEAHLAQQSDDTRRRVVDAYFECGLLPEEDAANVKSVIDFFDEDFFDLMGLVYANGGMFRCALRWYHEFIAGQETRNPNAESPVTKPSCVCRIRCYESPALGGA